MISVSHHWNRTDRSQSATSSQTSMPVSRHSATATTYVGPPGNPFSCKRCEGIDCIWYSRRESRCRSFAANREDSKSKSKINRAKQESESESCQVSQPHNTNRANPSAIPVGPDRRQVIWPENQIIRKRTSPCALPPVRARSDHVVLQSRYGAASNSHSHLPQ